MFLGMAHCKSRHKPFQHAIATSHTQGIVQRRVDRKIVGIVKTQM